MEYNDLIEKGNKILLSFIVPVYNVEKYLEDCLDSILNQDVSHEVYEIICVNDGSTDNSLEILKKYTEKYSNIRIVDKPNGGVSSARNEGIKNACGKWIWFIDSDDYIIENGLKFLLEQAEKNKTDLVVFAARTVDKFESTYLDIANVQISLCEGKDKVLDLSPKKSYTNGPVFYLFLREKIQTLNLLFDETMKYAEDTKFVLEYRFYSEKGLLIDAPLYCYRNNPQSAMHTLNAEAHAFCMKKLAETYDYYRGLCADNNRLLTRFEVARSRAVRNMLFDYCMYIRDYQRAKEALEDVRRKGWYPYKVKMKIYSKSFKGRLINIINKMLEVKWIYLLMCKIKAKKKR